MAGKESFQPRRYAPGGKEADLLVGNFVRYS
jgi:hypothetical protein